MQQQTFLRRRQELLTKLKPNSVVILKSATSVLRNGDTSYPYRQNSDFYYLTGFEEPEAVAVLQADQLKSPFILFNRPNDELHERWEGPRAGQVGAKALHGADVAYPIEQFAEQLASLLQGKTAVYCLFADAALLQAITQAQPGLQQQVRAGAAAPIELIDLASILHEMRLIKDQDEIELMRTAAQISAKAHLKAMQSCQPGMKEYELGAVLEYELSRHGCKALAYPSIVAGGANACVLHYTANNAELIAKDLVLVDAGGEYCNYAADITRTYPVSGKFSQEQREVYEIVLAAQLAVIDSIRPGVSREEMQSISERVITEGLIGLGILQGDLNSLLQARAYLPFYMHRIGHWLGLDVHDVGAYKLQGQWRELKAGMVLTVEPGIYISPNNPEVDAKWWGIGIRIEDDILVTQSGYEVLSAAAPKTVAAIEELMTNHAI